MITEDDTHNKVITSIDNNFGDRAESVEGLTATICGEREVEEISEALPSLSKSTTSINRNSPVTFNGSSLHQQDTPCQAMTNAEETAVSQLPSSQTLKRMSSSLRLSISLDGKAEVIVNGSTPSPPRLSLNSAVQHKRPGSLQRSQSAVDIGSQPFQEIVNSVSSWPRRSASGRSRDARAWEFYCDSDVRNALTVQAEQDQKGSALGLLGLIRSSSVKSNSFPNALNSTSKQTKQDSSKRKSHPGSRIERPKIARTASSMARLQTVDHNVEKTALRDKNNRLKSKSHQVVTRESSGDSDKENWDPNRYSSDVQRRRPLSGQGAGGLPRGILQENMHVPSHNTSLGVLLDRENLTPRRREKEGMYNKANKENIGVDEEIAAFMGESSVPREEVDLDCVQNLLSLSQGAWR